MSTWEVYLINFGVLLLGYVIVRLCIWDCMRLPKPPKERQTTEPGTALDAGPLAERVNQARLHYEGELRLSQDAFKKPLLVEQKREQLSQLAFFQRAPEREPHEKDEGLTLMFV